MTVTVPSKKNTHGGSNPRRRRRGGPRKGRDFYTTSTLQEYKILSSTKEVGKTMGNFTCTNDGCKRTWNSAHAWASERFQCEGCGGKAKVVEFKDEDCELDTYNCTACPTTWQAIHDPLTTTQECYCGAVVVKNDGTQIRNGRHYFYRCLNKTTCGLEWEDFYNGKKFTQRCNSCQSPGEMRSVSKVKTPRHYYGGRRGGVHDVKGCEMCQTLAAQGIRGTCQPKKLVIFNTTMDEDWTILDERIVGTVDVDEEG